MKKKRLVLFVSIIVLVVTLVPVLAACSSSGSLFGGTQDYLYIYNWEDYIDMDLVDEFEEYYKQVTGRSITVTYTTYDTNETMITKVQKGDANVDLICPSEYAIEKLMRGGYVLNITDIVSSLSATYGEELFSNLNNINSDVEAAIEEVFGSMNIDGETVNMLDYMIPYMYGTLGILYNTTVVSEEELEKYGWGILWNVGGNEDIEGKILVKDSIRDTYCAAVLYLKEYNLLPDGYENLSVAELINCTDDALLKAVEEALIEQRSHIAGYEVDFGKDDMLNEIVYVDLAWSGDALWAIDESYDEETGEYLLGYYVPETGSNIWYDGWVIPTTVQNELAAVMFIDYVCRPESAARNIGYIAYTSAVDKELLRADEDALATLLDVEYLWCASSEDSSLYVNEDYEYVFSYKLDDDDILYLNADGTSYTDSTDKLTAIEITNTDLDGYWLDTNGEYLIDALSMAEFFDNTARYPEITETLGVMQDYGDANDTVVRMWESVKAGSETPWVLIWCIIAVVGIILVGIAAYFIRQKVKTRTRKIDAEPYEHV